MDELLKISEVAQHLKVDRETVKRWMDEGLIDYVTLPRASGTRDAYRIKTSDLEALIDKGSSAKRNASEQRNGACNGRAGVK